MQLYLVPHWQDISDCYSDRQSDSVEACLSQTRDCTPTHQWPEPLSFNGSPPVSPVVVIRVPYSRSLFTKLYNKESTLKCVKYTYNYKQTTTLTWINSLSLSLMIIIVMELQGLVFNLNMISYKCEYKGNNYLCDIMWDESEGNKMSVGRHQLNCI